MEYKSIGTDDKRNKIYSDGEFAYYAKTPQQIFEEKATAYANSKPVTVVNKKNPNKTTVIPILTVANGKAYKQAVNKFSPEYSRIIAAKPKAGKSANIRLGGVY